MKMQSVATNPIRSVLFCGLAFYLSVRGEIASVANDSMLSREESIGAMFLVPDSEFKVLMFVNPSVLPTLRRMVQLYPDLPAHTAWSAIGCVGTERDVNYMRRILEKDSRGEHASRKAVFADWAIHRLGLLARCNVPGARKLLAEIAEEGTRNNRVALRRPPEAVDSVATLETDAGDYSDLFSDIVVVSWKLKGTQNIGKKILEDKLNYYPTLAEDDNLMVVTKKKDGKWYWNPFGW